MLKKTKKTFLGTLTSLSGTIVRPTTVSFSWTICCYRTIAHNCYIHHFVRSVNKQIMTSFIYSPSAFVGALSGLVPPSLQLFCDLVTVICNKPIADQTGPYTNFVVNTLF